MRIAVKRLPHSEGLPLPQYMTQGASGFDLLAAVEKPIVLKPSSIEAVPTGLIMAIPLGYEGQVRPRSGLALKHGISVPNAPGTIDSDYRGELKVILINLGNKDFTIERGDRIAQMIICRVEQVALVESPELDCTERNDGGFGHTGHTKTHAV